MRLTSVGRALSRLVDLDEYQTTLNVGNGALPQGHLELCTFTSSLRFDLLEGAERRERSSEPVLGIENHERKQETIS